LVKKTVKDKTILRNSPSSDDSITISHGGHDVAHAIHKKKIHDDEKTA
jgi:hypothetical protein